MDFVAIFGGIFAFFVICALVRWCCTRRSSQGMVIATPVVITSETHRVATGVQNQIPPGVVVQGHTTGTGVYPVMQVAYPTQQPYPTQPYPVVQQYPVQSVPPQGPPTQFPVLPQQTHPVYPGAAPTAPHAATGPPMANPPSYDQVMTDAYAPQAPYNPDYKGH
ncbi:uncharacterized protein LOC128267696 [Anopheles cruzii]|uniref:uncharacterized protein LOC128267696 n=1 Tax=Anopheles cruzii TaxID=68878 RepID=UPI0022EC4BB3|nr:uncharacterized protein LOC128267696 [Anopheles cruzii]